jgi:hypothetical protein
MILATSIAAPVVKGEESEGELKTTVRRVETIHPVKAANEVAFGLTYSRSDASFQRTLDGVDAHTIALAYQKEIALLDMVEVQGIIEGVTSAVVQSKRTLLPRWHY